VIENAQVARYDLIFQYGARWDINAIPVIGYNDDGSL